MMKNQKGYSTTAVLLVLVVIAVVGIAGWLVWNSRPKPLSVILEDVKTDISSSFNDIDVTQKKWTAQYTTNTPQKVANYDYSISPQSSSTITFGRRDAQQDKTITRFFFFKQKVGTAWEGEDINSPFAKKVTAIFQKNKFTVTKEGDNTVFKRDADTCLFSGAQLSCYNPDILASIAAESKPFIDAYLAKHPEAQAKDIVFGPLTIKSQDGSGVISSSHEVGYDIAEAVITVKDKKTVVLYYQKSGGDWRYVTEGEDDYGFRCGPMKADPDARKALYNQVCLSQTGHVRLDTNNRALQ